MFSLCKFIPLRVWERYGRDRFRIAKFDEVTVNNDGVVTNGHFEIDRIFQCSDRPYVRLEDTRPYFSSFTTL